eukprot:scaffold276_cov548-Prasinococcus_capsulatus_cf.AAC.15
MGGGAAAEEGGVGLRTCMYQSTGIVGRCPSTPFIAAAPDPAQRSARLPLPHPIYRTTCS